MCFYVVWPYDDSAASKNVQPVGGSNMDRSPVASPTTLSARHADLDMRLSREEARPLPDGALVAQLKKAKLQIKDALAQR